MTFTGTRRITAMEQWDQEAFDLMGPAFFRFDRGGTGHFRFIAVEGQMHWWNAPGPRAEDIPEDTIVAVIGDALRAVRAQSHP